MNNVDLKNINIKDVPLVLRVFITVVCCFAVFYFVYNMDIVALQRKLVTIEGQEDDLKVQVQAFINNLESINTDINQLPRLEESLKLWRAKFVTAAQTPDLLNDILRTGTSNGLQFSSFNPGADVSEGLYIKVPIKMVIQGSYSQIANFISQVANMPLIVVIGDFTMAKTIKATSPLPASSNAASMMGGLVTNLTLDVYRYAGK